MSVVDILSPTSSSELCEALSTAGKSSDILEIGGSFSKQTMGGAVASGQRLSTERLNRLLAYEPKDLTISVEAGMPWSELRRILDDNNQFIPIDPAFSDQATVGGVAASDSSGPRRRGYGSARDMTIGMTFATVEGKLVSSGGMVVKNVTGLDMAKLMIGSFGTLAVISTVNLKVLPKPVAARTFVFSDRRLSAVTALRNAILKSQLQPVALDLLAGPCVSDSQRDLFRLAVEAHGSEASVARYERDYANFASDGGVEFSVLEANAAEALWREVREFSSRWMTDHPEGGVLRISAAPAGLGATLEACQGASVSRAAAGVTYFGCSSREDLENQVDALRERGLRVLVEHASQPVKTAIEQWAAPDDSLAVMRRLKQELDPNNLLNPGRLFGQI